MTARTIDRVGQIDKELEIFRSELEQDFLRESQALEQKKRERLERLEEMTRETLATVDGEWQEIKGQLLDEISQERIRAFDQMEELLQGLDKDLVLREIAQSALCRLLGEEDRKDAGS